MIERQTNRPIYVQIKNMIEEMIKNQEYKPGDPLLSEHEMAEQLNVSRLTVRKAYSELVDIGILRAVQGKGTFVSEDLDVNKLECNNFTRNVNNKVIGIAVPEITNFFPEIIKGIEEQATANGYSLNIMFNDSFDKEQKVIENMIEKSVDGVILCPFRSKDMTTTSHFRLLKDANIPLVFVGKPPINVINNSVSCDDATGAYLATEYLINKGHKNIIHVTDYKNDKEAYSERKKGYVEAMNMNGLSENISIIDVTDTDWEKTFLNDFNNIKNNSTPSVFAMSDNLIFYIYNALLSNGIPIDNLDMVGYDNEKFNLPFSFPTVEQPKKLMGKLSFDLLLNEITTPNFNSVYAKHIIVKPNVLIRE